MANMNLPKGHRWKKGQTGNPKGSTAERRAKSAFKKMLPVLADRAPELTFDAMKTMVAAILAGSFQDVSDLEKQLGKDLCFSYGNWVVALQAAAKKGDVASLIRATEFVFGRQAEKLEVTGRDGSPLTVRGAAMTVEEMQAELAAIRARKKAQGIVG